MDPSEQLLRHTDPFNPSTDRLPTFANWVSQNAYVGTKRVRGAAKYTVKQTLHFFRSDSDASTYVNELKSSFDGVDKTQFRKCRDASNPFEAINHSIFMNRAAIKLANMDAVFGLTTRFEQLDVAVLPTEIQRRFNTHAFEPNETYQPLIKDPQPVSLTQGQIFWFVDIAGAPGGMSQYLLWRRPSARGFGISLRSTTDIGWNTDKLDLSRFSVNYGKGGDGDLYKTENIKSFTDFVKRQAGAGVHLAVADGGFDFEGQENDQESLIGRLLICQAATAILSMGPDGSFVLKLFDITKLLTVQVLQILADVFKQITVFKPISSRPGNSERYVVCQGFRGPTKTADILIAANEAFANGIKVTSLFGESNVDEELIAYVIENNNAIVNSQIDSLERLTVCLNPEVEGSETVKPLEVYNLDLSNKIWYLPPPMTRAANGYRGSNRGGGSAPSRGGRGGGYENRGGGSAPSRGGRGGGYENRGRGSAPSRGGRGSGYENRGGGSAPSRSGEYDRPRQPASGGPQQPRQPTL